ncbi:SpoIIE family protein phosphatase [Alloacidobacterium dinghuense]|uniref:SpoIIE family protein phosphatase n=1 Tax=Alloacidobacterium dinghuense TaxID=2763107 RepID=A0A7G8BEW5_9BACT|nr:SpoIIE family protein phosphatase [Alloacidobacterium dinghuense]QNI31085.1 SpoIIE family protein phosphatase [Alloacidobacterium dinghuense]
MKINKVSPNLLRFFLGLYVLASVGYWLSTTLDHWTAVFHPERHVQAPFVYDNDTCVIGSLQPEARAAKVPEGAHLDSLNGVPYSARVWDEILNTAHPDDMMDVGFTRKDGSTGTATITFVPQKPLIAGIPYLVLSLQEIILAGVALGCLLMGFWVVIAKPTDGNAWLLLILLNFPTVLFSLHHGFATGLGALFLEFWFQTMQFAASPALLLFGIYFPERSRWNVRFPWAKWVILIPLLLCAVIFGPIIYGSHYGAGNGPMLVRAGHWAEQTTNFLNLVCLVLSLALTLDKLRSASTEDARRRLRVLTTGMSIGLSALLLVFIVLPHFGITPAQKGRLWIGYAGITAFLFAPFSLVYVVLVQRAMDVRILLRMGARYALAKATLWVVQIALLTVVAVELILPIFGKKQPQLADLLGPLIFFALVMILRMGVHKRIQQWLDRRFFREAYDAERVLNELAEEVRRYTETEPLLETVARCVAETLHVDQIAMLLRRGEYFVLQQSIGIAAGRTLTLPLQSSAVRYLTNSNEPARLYREDPDAWYLMAGTAERYALDKMNSELLLPLPGRNRMMGVMALGPKRSEAAYSSADLKLLQALASQTGLALEVSELARSLASEAAQRERINREMEIAREVQERLFPQEMPELPGAKIAGYCRPALGVGGDYYDVIDIGDGRVGLAVGDVSGKGISAALLMASLRASLRGVTLDSPRDFAKLMHKVNRLVYEASASNRYATFFFASYDPATRKLECVNAGHNPPVLLRNGETIRLEADGPVVGLLPFAPYTEQTLTLEPGDLLILYTDGISEAMTKEDEEWGDERMIEAARRSLHKPANDVLDDLFAAADVFTAGAPQHDDMTLLILKLEP